MTLGSPQIKGVHLNPLPVNGYGQAKIVSWSCFTKDCWRRPSPKGPIEEGLLPYSASPTLAPNWTELLLWTLLHPLLSWWAAVSRREEADCEPHLFQILPCPVLSRLVYQWHSGLIHLLRPFSGFTKAGQSTSLHEACIERKSQ